MARVQLSPIDCIYKYILEMGDENPQTQILFFNKLLIIDEVYTEIFGSPRERSYIYKVNEAGTPVK